MSRFKDPFVISDLHLGHSKLADLRGFGSTKEHDQHLADQWNATVSATDQVIVLGDVSLNSHFDLRHLNGHKYLVMGNHDTFSTERFIERGFVKLHGALNMCKGGKDLILTHIPVHPAQFKRWDLNIHGHLHRSRVRKWGGLAEDKRYYNASVEQLGFVPKRISTILKEVFKQ